MSQHGIMRTLGAALLVALVTPVAAEDPTLYGVSGNRYVQALLRIDPDDGAVTEVGDTAVVGMRAVSCAPDGMLWAAADDATTATIYTIDPATGAATAVGASGFRQIDALAVAPSGTIYASVRPTDDADAGSALATIDPATGAGALVAGNYGLGTIGIVGLALSPAGVLYGSSSYEDPAEQGLYTIDRVTGIATRIGRLRDALGLPLATHFTGLGFAPDGTLFAVTENPLPEPAPLSRPRSGVDTGADLITLDPATAWIAAVRGRTNYIVSDMAACGGAPAGAVFAILPETAGNGGPMTAVVYTSLATGADVSVALARAGEADVVAAAVTVEPALHRLQAVFDLTGVTPGAFDVVVREVAEPDRRGVLAGGFTVEAAHVAIVGIAPTSGGNAGEVTLVMRARHVAAGVAARLVRGVEELVAGTVRVVPGEPLLGEPALVSATFDLGGRTPGAFDVVLENPGGPAAVVAGGFTVVAGGAADVALGVVGRNRIRTGRDASYLLTLDNRGSLDARGTPVVLGVPAGATWSVDFGRDPFPDAPHAVQEMPGPELYLPAMRLPPGVSRTLVLTIRVPADQTFQLRALWEPLP